MVCSVCKRPFIRSIDLTEYYQNKSKTDDELLTQLNALPDADLTKNSSEIWEEILNSEALLLHPNYKPNKCNTNDCNSLICNYCYNNKTNICLHCNPLPSPVKYDNLTHNK